MYGYRVDNVHHDAYKMMGSFARNQNGDVQIQLVERENDVSDEEERSNA